jgi:glycosyltransferase involved in cell wall biosynthesis
MLSWRRTLEGDMRSYKWSSILKKLNEFKKTLTVAVILLIAVLMVSKNYIRGVLYSYSFNEQNVSSADFFHDIKRSLLLENRKIPKKPGVFRVVLVNKRNFIGEAQTALRLSKILSKLGWEWCICDQYNFRQVSKINPDLILSLRPEIVPWDGCINLLFIHMIYGFENKTFIKAMSDYDGFIQVVPQINELESYFAQNHRKLYKVLSFLSVEKTAFCQSPKVRLFYCGANWDNKRKLYYDKLYKLLDSTDYFDVYGPNRTWKEKKIKAYRGSIPPSADGIQKAMQKNGIALVLHSDHHLNNNITTSRIFEAAAASCVIICDKHKFIMENFGDSVFYIDVDQSTEKIFKQIDAHVKWIRANPQKAMEMARKSHEIFVKNFTLEKEVEKIKNLYDILRKRALVNTELY